MDRFAQAVAAQQAGDFAAAQMHYATFLEQHPNHVPALTNLSGLLLQKGDAEGALMLVEHAIALDDSQPALHYYYGRILMRAQLPAEALTRFERACALSPDTAEFYAQCGMALFELGRYEEAIAHCNDALARDAHAPEYINNRANALTQLGRYGEAMADYRAAAALVPGHAEIETNLALLELMQGDFAQGWRRHEWRLKRARNAPDIRVFTQPLWLGDAPIDGKTILLYPEQGLGDVIQFARYALLLHARGAKVILEVHAPLVALMQTLHPEIIVIARDSARPPFDYQCPLMSLPLAFSTRLETIPAAVPYLAVNSEKRAAWQARLGARTRPRVGLCWSGSAAHVNDRQRSIPLAALTPLLALPFEFHALQKEIREADRIHLAGMHVHSDALQDFSDTAALAEAMDVIVSVDTSVLHLAGALAKPTLALLPFVPDFRWLLAREDSPWYPSVRLLRQSKPGDWQSVIALCGERLRETL